METIQLLEGVEILSASNPIPLGFSIFLGMLCFVVIILSAYLIISTAMDGSVGGIVLSLFFLGVGIFLSSVVITETINPTITYKVTVDDSVPMNEFYEKYEVINVEGKIYSIQMKGG